MKEYLIASTVVTSDALSCFSLPRSLSDTIADCSIKVCVAGTNVSHS
jgi:hypothetical protein